MDREWRDEWVRALRSGEFKQGRGQLRHAGRYCCLGVLCQLRPDIKWRGGDAIWGHGEEAGGTLPLSLAVELGMRQHHVGHLVDMNDGDKIYGVRKHSFAEIADYIEANL